MALLRKNWFLLVLVLALLVGFHQSAPLRWLTQMPWLKWLIVSATMFLMAWPLAFGDLRRTFLRPGAALVGSGINVIAIPLAVWPIWGWFGEEMGPGILIVAATPCTLASAAIWTRRAGGNDSVAILVTLITNATCFLVMPFWIYVQTGSSIDSSVLVGTIYKLFAFVVLPIAAAQFVRLHSNSAIWATRNKPGLSTLAMVGILMMVLIGAVSMGLRMGEQQQTIEIGSIMAVGLTVAMIHVLALGLGLVAARILDLPPSDGIAVAFSGSQKTLMIGLTVAILLHASIIPMVMYHAIQLILDTLIADRMAREKTSKALPP